MPNPNRVPSLSNQSSHSILSVSPPCARRKLQGIFQTTCKNNRSTLNAKESPLGHSARMEKKSSPFLNMRNQDSEVEATYFCPRKFRKSGSSLMIFIVLCIGLLGLLQVLVYENQWRWGRSELLDISATSSLAETYKNLFHFTPSNVQEGVTDPDDQNRSTTETRFPKSPQESAACIEAELMAVTDPTAKGFSLERLKEECIKHTAPHSKEEEDPDLGGTTEGEQEFLPIGFTRNEPLGQENLVPSNTFLPLIDKSQEALTDSNRNWFMSSLRGRAPNGFAESFDLPLDDPRERLLCVRGMNTTDGSGNSYGLFRKDNIPAGAIMLKGTTLIADNYWDYRNPWHSMSALVNFVTWRMQNDCKKPDRLVLYSKGELTTFMGDWITNVLHASLGKHIEVETLIDGDRKPYCFQRAIVQRRGLGGISKENVNKLFDLLRCKARKYCKIDVRYVNRKRFPKVGVLLLERTGARAFVNSSAMADVIREECKEVKGCYSRVMNIDNLNFCEQVELLTSTEVLITAHGAQLTNMMFMSPGTSVMEMYPKGWLEFAGIGQNIYKWLADWTSVVHEGAWRDPEGPDCPYPTTDTLPCLLFYKDREVGMNATYLAQWTRGVLHRFAERQRNEVDRGVTHCLCEKEDIL